MINKNVHKVTITSAGALADGFYYLTEENLKNAVTKFLTQHDLKGAIKIEIALLHGKIIT